MANFDDGVRGHIEGRYQVSVFFPVDWRENIDVNCYQCKFFSRNTGICQLTKEISEYPTKYIGSHCPLEFDGEILPKKREEK